MEVIYATVETGKFVNRGFLNGTYCPIYGFGALLVILTLNPIRHNIFLLFLGSVILATLLELVTGVLLEKLFHTTWWDYSDMPFNVGGYICLKFSLLWGIGCVILVRGIHPLITTLVSLIPVALGQVLLTLFILVIITDAAATITAILKFNEKLRLMNEIALKIRVVSDGVGGTLSDGVSTMIEKTGSVKESIEEQTGEVRQDVRDELKELLEKYKTLLEKRDRIQKRMLKAFPAIKSKKYQDILDKMKEHYRIGR